jgi:hypothetical protein
MKKLTLSALIFVAFTNGAIAADAPNPVRASLELVKNGVPMYKVGLAMLEGHKTPYRNTTTFNYRASCDPDSTGHMVASPASLTTGLVADVTPVQVDSEGALLAVALNYSLLEGITHVREKDCTVDLPAVHEIGDAVTVKVKRGEAVELSNFGGQDGYVLVVRGL